MDQNKFIFDNSENTEAFLRNSVKIQLDFYKKVEDVLTGMFKPNIVYVCFFGSKCSAFLD